VADEFEAGIANEMLDVGLATGEEVVEADDVVTLLDEAVTEVGTEESGSAGDEDTHGERFKGRRLKAKALKGKKEPRGK
jgi:hypothetical protein